MSLEGAFVLGIVVGAAACFFIIRAAIAWAVRKARKEGWPGGRK